MKIFVLLGKYSQEALKEACAARTEQAVKIIEKYGGKVLNIYGLLGEYDLILLLEFPSPGQALETSVALNRLTGIAFKTLPAVDVKEFDEMLERAKCL